MTQPFGSRDQAHHHIPGLPLEAREHLHEQAGWGRLRQ